jgi:hypothetical protein
MNPDCRTAHAVKKHLIHRDESSAIRQAIAGGLPSLREFGTRIAAEIDVDALDSPRCVILQVARAIGTSETTLQQLAHQLG